MSLAAEEAVERWLLSPAAEGTRVDACGVGRRITPSVAAVLKYLARCHNGKSGQCNPKNKTIQAQTKLSERSVRRAVRCLEVFEAVTSTPDYAKDGSQRSSKFDLQGVLGVLAGGAVKRVDDPTPPATVTPPPGHSDPTPPATVTGQEQGSEEQEVEQGEAPPLREGASVVPASPTTDGDHEGEAIDDAPDDPAGTTGPGLEAVDPPKPTQAALPGLEDAQPPPKQSPRKLVMAFYRAVEALGHPMPGFPKKAHLKLAKDAIAGSQARFDRLMFLVPEWLSLPAGHHGTDRPLDFKAFATRVLECDALTFVREPRDELERQVFEHAALARETIAYDLEVDVERLLGSNRQWQCAVFECCRHLPGGLKGGQLMAVRMAVRHAVKTDEFTRENLSPRYLVRNFSRMSRLPGAPSRMEVAR